MMNNNQHYPFILVLALLLMVSCAPRAPAPQTIETATPHAEPVESPTNEVATAENTPAFKYETIGETLPIYLINSDYQALEALMGESFSIGYWGSDDQMLTPAEAIEQLQINWLPDPTTFRFTRDRRYFPDLGEVDPTKAFGYEVEIVDLVYSEGWGVDGQGAAILTIGLNVDGQYWPGMIYAPTGFDEGTEINGGPQEAFTTYVNEHAGYAFDYPSEWIVEGEPMPEAYIYVIALKSYKLERGPGPFPADEVKLDFVTCNSAQCNTLEAVQTRFSAQVASGEIEILSEETWTLAGGTLAIRRQLIGEMGLEVASLLTEFNGKALRVSGYGDLTAFDDVVRTLRPAISVPSETGLRAISGVPQSLPQGETVKLQFFLINDSDGTLYILNWFTPLEGLGGEIFRVKRNGVILPYQGPLASRAEPGPDSYTRLEAGEMVSAEVVLSEAYDFSLPGNYTIEFISPRISHVARSEAEMAKSYDELGPIQIPTNEVTVEIAAEDISSTDRSAAQDTLARYFRLLNEGNYADAAELYGGEYGVLRDWNPSVDPNDLAGLLEMGCTTNGLRCLSIKSITPMGPSALNTYEFAVQFENPDGSLFILDHGGDWPEYDLPRSLFTYSVVPGPDGFVIQELPVYAP